MRPSLLFLFLFYLPLQAEAQDFRPQFLRYSSADGLLSDRVYCLEEDDLGYIWIGTSEGLCRFDGSVFFCFKEMPGVESPFKGEKIIALFKDHKGNIWAGTKYNGLNVIYAKTGAIHNFHHRTHDFNSLGSNEVKCIFEDYKGRIWVGADGLNLLDSATGNFTRVTPFKDPSALKKYNGWQNEILRCVQDPENPYIEWLTTAYGVCKFNVETFETQYFFLPENHSGPTAFRSSFLDQDHILWLTDWGTGLHRFDTRKEVFQSFRCTDDGLPKNYLNAADIHSFDQHRLLLACENNGLMLFDKNHKRFSPVLSQEEGPSTPRYFLKDSHGNLWISTLNSGLYCLQPQRQIFEKTILSGHINQVLESREGHLIYACSEQGQFFVYDKKKGQTAVYQVKDPLVPSEPGLIDLAYDQQQQLWVLGMHDIYRWQESTRTLQPLKWPGWQESLKSFDYFWDFEFNLQNNLWVSAQNIGLAKIDIDQKRVFPYRNNPNNPYSLVHDYSVGQIFTDKNHLWGVSGEGFFHYDPNTDGFFNSPSPPAVSDNGPAFSGSRAITLGAQGDIWIAGMLNRIGILRAGTDMGTPLEIIKPSVSLPQAPVSAMLADYRGNIWIASGSGLTKINPINFKAEHYGASYGLFAVNNLNLAQNGEILAAVPGGYFRFHPDSIAPIAKSPIPIISEFKVFDKAYNDGIQPAYLEQIELSYQQNFFSFEFSSLDFNSKEPKEFAYKLEGLQSEWVNAGERRYAAFTNISGGEYTFKVRVRSESGLWSEAATLHLRIVPPIWMCWWFWLLAILAICALIYGVYRYRINQIRNIEALKTKFNKQLAEMEMKALRAQMNPHFLFNSLNAIKFYVLKRSKEKAAEYLTDFARLIRLVLHNSSRQLVSLKEELEALELYVRIESLRFDEQFDVEINIQPTIDTDGFLIPPLLLQPYVENAIWHGLMHKKTGKGKLLIALTKENDTLQCIIEDNGIGREKAKEVRSKSAQKNKSMGMSITRDRMDISQLISNMQYEVQVLDLFDEAGKACGTRVIIQMQRSNIQS